jgi:hypothetical protein
MRVGSNLARRAPRNADFGELQETFLVAAVATILVIRTQLWLTNYPQLGGHGLHIAHLLYGGMFMVIAIGILLTFVGRSPRRPAAIIGGVGFGFFIDELGKFITADNNYFFQPAPALIYLVFIGLFMLSRAMRRRGGLSPAERLANAIELLADAAQHKLDVVQKRRALELLDGADPTDPVVAPLRRLLGELDAIPAAPLSRAARWAGAVRAGYLRLIEQRAFRPIVGWIFAVWALVSVAWVFEVVLPLGIDVGGALPGFRSDAMSNLAFVNVASLVGSTASAVLVAVGLEQLRRHSRLDAYRMFDRALLVSIFGTRVFAFVESQFGAVFGLGIDLLMLVTVRYIAEQERRLDATAVDRPARRRLRSAADGLASPASQ